MQLVLGGQQLARQVEVPAVDQLLRRSGAGQPFAAREGEARTFEGRGLPELVLEGLEDEDALALLEDRSSEIVSSVRGSSSEHRAARRQRSGRRTHWRTETKLPAQRHF